MDEARMDSVPHPLSLSGQEECIMDTSSSSLSLAGAEKETPPMIGHAVMMDYYNSLSDEEKTKIHVEALKANPRASAQELIEVKRSVLWKAIHGAQKRKSQDEKREGSLFPTPFIFRNIQARLISINASAAKVGYNPKKGHQGPISHKGGKGTRV